MIARIAMFHGTIREGLTQAFRQDVRDTLVPLYRRFTGCTEVRILFCDECDDGAPEYPLILSITYPDEAAFDTAMASPARLELRDMIGDFLVRYFDGSVEHHTAELAAYTPLAG